ncbi:MAG: SusC/RagA family TonB-linked outer membrane protein [Ferruginibacter sp.]|nr:SusC/RagA family TonB-linked outer membrane protein [Ferruginibacter sp.]
MRLHFSLLALLLTFFTTTYCQQIPISGKVTDEKGLPLAGAVVYVKGGKTQTITKEDGTFSINVTNASDVLVASSINRTPVEIKLNGKRQVSISLVTITKSMDEVIVVSALGIARTQKSLTYASQTVKTESLTEARDLNVLSGLAGKVAGLQITGTGQPGGSARLTLRGDNSLSGSNQPLIVVDGVPLDNPAGDAGGYLDYGNPAGSINPDDIESITVLKGPNGAALYGAKAANGAILITLKKGKPGGDGTLGIDVNQSTQFYKITAFPEYQNVYGEGSAMRYAANSGNNVNQTNFGVNMGTSNQSWGAAMLGQPFNDFSGKPIEGGYVPQPNNVSDLYQNSFTSSTNLSISKSDANSAFRLSYGFTKGNDAIDNLNKLKKHTLLLTASRNLGSKIKISTRVSYINTNTQNRMPKGLSVENPLALYVYMTRSTRLSGFMPYKDANGNSIATGQVNDTENPFWSIYADKNEDTRAALNGGITAEVSLTSALKFRGQIVGDLATSENYIYKELGSRKTKDGFYSNDLRRQNNWYYEGLMMYNKKLHPNLSFDALAGVSMSNNNTLDRAASISALLVHEMPSIGNANSVPTASESLLRAKQQSAFAKASFGFKDFLYLDVSGRNEWSSSLPVANNSFFYSMIGGGFVFSEFIHNKNLLSSGKLRLNYAKVGNSTGAYQLTNTYSPQGLYMGSPYLAYTTTLKNADLKPEQSISKEIGLDLSLFKNKVGISATYYQNSNINQILTAQTAYESGYTGRVVNAGEIQNKGFELSINAAPVQTKKFTWRSTVNFATNKSLVVSLIPGVNKLQLGQKLNMTVNALVGQPYGIQMGNRPYRIGDTILVSTGGRAIVQTNVITGNPRPKWTGGFQNTFTYGAFSLQVTATVKWGGVVFSESYGRAMFQGTTVKSLEGRDDWYFSSNILGESDAERRNQGQIVGTTTTRYWDSVRNKGLTYPNAYLQKVNPVTGVPLVDKDGNYIVGSPFIGEVYPQLVNGNDKVGNDVPYLTFDASSVRISELVFGYTLPKTLLGKKSFVKGAYVAVSARNIWQIYQKTPIGIDPESALGTTNGSMGIESGGSFPYATLGFSLKLSF